MRYKLAVFGACWAIILGLEFLFDVPPIAMGSDSFAPRFLIAVLVAAGATFFWLQLRPARPLAAVPVEDAETMLTRASMVPQLYAAYARLRARLLEKLVDGGLVEVEERFYADSLVWRRQYLANPSPGNKEKCDFHFNNLRELHAGWECNHPELKELNERVGNCREALFILEHGTRDQVRSLLADAKTHGWGTS
jgi:hypothetical protein